MKIAPIAAAILLAAPAAPCVAATTFYKLTDPTGRVTYLDRPPAEFDGRVEVLNVNPDANTARLPGLEPAQRPQTEAERIIRSGQAERLSEAKAAEQQVQRAQAELAAARAALQQAQDNSLAEDWFYQPNRTRVQRPEYAARIEALDASVKMAEANLAEAEQRLRFTY